MTTTCILRSKDPFCTLQHLAGHQAKEFLRSMLKMETFFEYIERKPELPTSGTLKPEQLRGTIEFKDVCFSYPTRPNTQVLKVHSQKKRYNALFNHNHATQYNTQLTVACEKLEPLFFLDYSANMCIPEGLCFMPDCEITCVSFSNQVFTFNLIGTQMLSKKILHKTFFGGQPQPANPFLGMTMTKTLRSVFSSRASITILCL